MNYEYVDPENFKDPKIRLVSDKDGRLFVRKNAHIDSLLAERLTKISCPRIVQFIEFGEDDEGEYVIEEYIDGVTAAESSFTQKQAVKVLLELCDALKALHSAKIVHRDIKPSNIIITKDGHTKLIDFDASRIEKIVKDKDTQILGTEGFAPPEQFGFSQTDSRSDIYSFGVTMNMILGDNSAPFLNIIKKCKALDPNDRYDSISKVKTAIRLAALKRFAAIPAAALMLIVFTVVLSTVLNHKVPADNMIGSESGGASDTYQSPEPLQSPEPSQSSDQPQSSEPSQSSEFLQSSDPPQSSEPSQSSEPPQSTEPPQSAEPPHSSAPPQSSDPPQSEEPLHSSELPQSSEPSQSSEPPQSSEPLQNIKPPPSFDPPFFSTITNSSGDYEDVCNYVFNDDPSVHGSWNAVGTLEKSLFNGFIKGRTEYLIRTIDDMLIQAVTLSADGSADVNNGSGARWTKDYFIMRYNDTQFVEELIYAKVNGTEYILIEDKTDGYAKTGTTDKYFVFMNANSRKIIYTTVLCDDGHYDDICDYVFYDDPAVHGTWENNGIVGKDELDEWSSGALDAEHPRNDPYYEYYTKERVFTSDGTEKLIKNNGSSFTSIWTNGYIITESGDGKTIEEYFIAIRDGIEYLFVEHKSGEYSREREVVLYYVFTRKGA